jgi:hypothetical protein
MRDRSFEAIWMLLRMSREIEAIFLRLVSHASILGRVFELAGQGGLDGSYTSRGVANLVGIGASRLPDVGTALSAAAQCGTMQHGATGWRITIGALDCYRLGLLLKGAALYKERAHQDRDLVRVVLSKPPQPSRFLEELENSLEGSWGLLATSDLLGEMAARAERRMSIMSPFVDRDGARRIVQLFDATRAEVSRELVVRDGIPLALQEEAGELCRLGVKVFDFRLPRSDRGETETFHAKVVRIDEHECYVGSSNMTRWSFDYSLELGFHVTGQAAAQVSRVIDAVVRVSNIVSLRS